MISLYISVASITQILEMRLFVFFAFLCVIEANEEFRCKPRPGCQLAKCDPEPPINLPSLLNKNEYPINCVRTTPVSKDSDQEEVLKSHKQRISELTGELTDANEKIKELEKKSDETSKVVESQSKIISKLTVDMVKANEKMEKLEKNSGYCQLRYEGKCFWFEWYGRWTFFNEAATLCNNSGGGLANVYSEIHYNLLVEYLRIYANPKGFTAAWIGLKYKFATNSVTLSNGNPAPFVKWYAKSPDKVSGKQEMSIVVRTDRGNPDQHMYNGLKIGRGVICEK